MAYRIAFIVLAVLSVITVWGFSAEAQANEFNTTQHAWEAWQAGELAGKVMSKRQVVKSERLAGIAQMIGKKLYRQFGITVTQAEAKHWQWFIRTPYQQLPPSERAKYWEVLENLMEGLGQDLPLKLAMR